MRLLISLITVGCRIINTEVVRVQLLTSISLLSHFSLDSFSDLISTELQHCVPAGITV